MFYYIFYAVSYKYILFVPATAAHHILRAVLAPPVHLSVILGFTFGLGLIAGIESCKI